MRRSLLWNLILCNAIWAGNPVAGKVLLRSLSPLQVSWLRCLSALLTAWLLALLLAGSRHVSPLREALRPRELRWILAMGLLSFFGSSVLQILGLAHTTATANVVLIATEPLIASLLAFAVLREPLRRRQLFAFAASLAGVLLLSNLKPGDPGGSIGVLNRGNLILLLSMAIDSMFSVISRRLSGRVAPVSFFALAVPTGFCALSLYLWLSGVRPGIPPDAAGWLALLYIGPLGTGLTYIYWSVALAEASVAAVSLTLFVQPLLGALAGMLLLDERLDLWQGLGAALILAALYVQTKTALQKAPERN